MQITVGSAGTPHSSNKVGEISCLRLSRIQIVDAAEAVTPLVEVELKNVVFAQFVFQVMFPKVTSFDSYHATTWENDQNV